MVIVTTQSLRVDVLCNKKEMPQNTKWIIDGCRQTHITTQNTTYEMMQNENLASQPKTQLIWKADQKCHYSYGLVKERNLPLGWTSDEW
jgi:hypothetical protein